MGVNESEFEHTPRLFFDGVKIRNVFGGKLGMKSESIVDTPVAAEEARGRLEVRHQEEMDLASFTGENCIISFMPAPDLKPELGVKVNGFVKIQGGKNRNCRLQHG